MKVLLKNKRVGMTPLELVKKVRADEKIDEEVKISYAGRLDPMARGLMLLLVGDENKNRDKYLGLDKVYRFDVVFGLKSDSHDVLGMVEEGKKFEMDEDVIEQKLIGYRGKIIQEYPPFSSRTVGGKALFEWAKEGRLDEIEIPSKEVEVKKLEMVGFYWLKKNDVMEMVQERVDLVEGNFRQSEVMESWKKVIIETENDGFWVVCFEVGCSSGFYVRKLVDDLGRDLGCGGLALDIERVGVGKYGKW